MNVRSFLFRCMSGVALFAVTAAMVAPAHDIIFGVGMHSIDYPRAAAIRLGLAKSIGADSLRTDAQWALVEKKKGVYKIPRDWDQFVNSARRLGIQPVLVLDYGNKFYDNGGRPLSPQAIEGFVRFATFVVKHFARRVRYYEIWNEWNVDTSGIYTGADYGRGTAEEYARLFDATYTAIKRVDPNSIVLATAGYRDWYEQLAKVGVAARADGVSIHPYSSMEPGYRPSVGSNGAERSVQKVIDAERTMRRIAGKEIPLYVTEIGWPTSPGEGGFPAQDVGAMAERSLLMLAALPYVRGVWWYDLVDNNRNVSAKSRRFGLFRNTYAPKPAARVFQSLSQLLKHNRLSWNAASNLRAGLVVLNDGSAIQRSVIAWHVQTPSASERKGGRHDVLSCNSPQRILRAQRTTDTDRTITSAPAVFTIQAGRCVREPLLAGRRQ